ncbi:MAG: arylesterase [Chthoniobacteraceae bacterium]|nr:arylesterase [Chthoniobacteraceae bacterium]
MLMWMSASLWAAEPAAANPGARGRIVVLGDSITAGYGLDRARAYPALLQQKLDQAGLAFEVINAGVSGDTTSGGLRRIDWALSKGAQVLIVALGGNDGLRGISPSQTEQNLAGILERARTKIPGIAVIVAGMQMPANMGAKFAEEFGAVFPRVAEAKHAELVAFLLEGVGGIAALNQADQIHPTAEGQKRVAENVWKVLEKVLNSPGLSVPRS